MTRAIRNGCAAVCAGDGAVFGDRDCDGLDDRVGHLYRAADMSRTLGSPALLIAAWLVTAAMTIIGALSYGELAAMMPKAGGQYVYLREALGPLWGFLYGWTLFLVIQTGTIAAVGVAFGKFLGVFFPSVSASELALAHRHVPPLACGADGAGQHGHRAEHGEPGGDCDDHAADVLNTLGVKLGAAVQNVFTSAKVLALLAVIAVGVLAKNAVRLRRTLARGGITSGRVRAGIRCIRCRLGVGGPTAAWWGWALTVVAVVQVGSLFSVDAWNNVTFTAGEIENPKRNLPLSLAMGTGVVLLLYVLATLFT
jgi:APA family basic amino acid/polyamine antiporter